MRTFGLYIHVPFCMKRCNYCNFYTTTDTGVERVCSYVAAVKTAIKGWASSWTSTRSLATIYFGGGTPSILGRHLIDILAIIREVCAVAECAEITVEANPASLDAEIMQEWVAAGINRISLGVQSFDAAALRTLGRAHTVEDIFRTVALLDEMSAGTDLSYALDLICGVPGQDEAAWRSVVEMAIACDPAHVSVYPLTVEEDTPLAAAVASGAVEMLTDDNIAQQMLTARALLTAAGYQHYEVANYMLPEHEGQHNTGYWTGVEYLGIGPCAASMFMQEDGSRVRFTAHATRDEFLADPVRIQSTRWHEHEVLTPAEAMREDLMLGMRLIRGIRAQKVAEANVTIVFEQLCADGLVRFDAVTECFVPTDRGWLLGNEMYAAVWSEGI
ncbi:MAG: radical SAM family heme chaperone HemW [Coriobacteriia bacterium]|nr:radical SAM family heme chaperone HemW [Coriobacteriia bacterium]